ncbi:MAG TPA: Minf_1886 family protein [Planctomycetaceae bacterium]|nr:Minf_1886 family protein [Planctomycetaceae bacterium]
MTTTGSSPLRRQKYPRNAEQFVFEALHKTQKTLQKKYSSEQREEETHISGQELLEGIRRLALQQFGLMATTVFHQWGIYATEDFGRLVFSLVEQGKMKKTEQDTLNDFCAVYSFEDAFDRGYRIDSNAAFEK